MASKQSNVSSSSNEESKGASEINFSGIFGSNTKKEESTRASDDQFFAKQKNNFDCKQENVLNAPSPTPEPPKVSEMAVPKEINYDEIKGNCIKVSNMCPSTSYSDLRRFFSGLYIANNGIKMINDKHGLRIGIAYVRFVRPESKPKAFIRNGQGLKSKRVLIESCTEEEFDDAIDSFKPARKISRFDQTEEMKSPIGGEKEEPVKEQKGEISFSALVLKQVPSFATEQDIMKMFSSYTLLDIVLTKYKDNQKQVICYIKFNHPEDAKRALKDKAKHIIGHRQIVVDCCSDEEFDKAKERHNMEMEMREDEEREEEEENDDNMLNEQSAYDPFVKDSDENTAEDSKMSDGNGFNREGNVYGGQNDRGNSGDMNQLSQIPSLLSLPQLTGDPRRRGGGRQGSRFSRPEDNQNKTVFAVIKNCDYRSTTRDFVDFFADLGITPNRVEILYNNRNQPSGDCIVEFKSPEDAEKSLLKNNRQCGSRNVRIELILPDTVAERLGEDFMQQGNNRGDSYPSLPPFNGDSNDNGNFNPGIQEQLMKLLSKNFLNANNSGMSNISEEDMSENQNPFRQGGNNGNNVNNSQNQRGNRGLDDNRSGNRRGQRKSRFSDFKDNKRFGGNQNTGMQQNVQQNMPQNMPQTLNSASVDQFGQPGCVVSMENVPYKAGIEDILDFFRKFNVQPHNVIRRYNDDGTPTGDARVAFSSPMEARAAIESKRQQKIFNRTIFLSMI